MSRKLVLDDGRAERELVVRDKLTVGRDPACEISDADPRLSRRHAEFRSRRSGIVVRDLDSRNGVRVNGRAVQETLLSPGDLVEVAHLSLRFVDDGKSEAGRQPTSGFPASVPRPVEGVQVKDGFEDDRTRVVPVPGRSRRRPRDRWMPGDGDDDARGAVAECGRRHDSRRRRPCRRCARRGRGLGVQRSAGDALGRARAGAGRAARAAWCS